MEQQAPETEPVVPAPERAAEPPQRAWHGKWLALALVTLVVCALDQCTKHWAQNSLQPRPGRRIVLVEGYLALSYVRNPGAAWGFLARSNESFRRPFFIGISLLAMGFILYLFRRLERGQLMLMTALSLVMGGAIGNFIDRIRYNYVVDFVDFHVKHRFKWPTFNVADVAITVGVVLLFIEMFVLPRLRRRQARTVQPAPAPLPERSIEDGEPPEGDAR
jgi:signal peptidase II